MVVIEMNPRVSRSSALASKATGFPIAKIAAKLAVGYTLDELRNDITRETPACFEPTIDYVVTKIPRFTFEKFPQARDVLGPQMKSVGEAMAIGRTFKESLQKALRSLEIGRAGFEPRDGADAATSCERRARACPNARPPLLRRRRVPARAARSSEVHDADADRSVVPAPTSTRSSPTEHALAGARSTPSTPAPAPRSSSSASPTSASRRCSATTRGGRPRRAARRRACAPVYKPVDTCAAEFEALHAVPLLDLRRRATRATPTSATEDHHPRRRPEPHRAGHRVRLLLRARGASRCARTASRPSWSTATRRRSRPTTTRPTGSTSSRSRSRTCSRIVQREKPDGVIVQFGGQTPLKLAVPLERGRRADPRHVARRRSTAPRTASASTRCSTKLGLRRPPNGIARIDRRGRSRSPSRIGYPVLVRPSYVLGGRAMEIVYDRARPRALHAARGRARRPSTRS